MIKRFKLFQFACWRLQLGGELSSKPKVNFGIFCRMKQSGTILELEFICAHFRGILNNRIREHVRLSYSLSYSFYRVFFKTTIFKRKDTIIGMKQIIGQNINFIKRSLIPNSKLNLEVTMTDSTKKDFHTRFD